MSKNNGHWPTHAKKAKGREQRKKRGPAKAAETANQQRNKKQGR